VSTPDKFALPGTENHTRVACKSEPESHLGLEDSAENSKRKIYSPRKIFLGELETSFWPGSNYHPHPSPVIARSCFRSCGMGIATGPGTVAARCSPGVPVDARRKLWSAIGNLVPPICAEGVAAITASCRLRVSIGVGFDASA
jgi:hypothetical protein